MGKQTYDQVKKLIMTNNKAKNFSNELIISVAWKESSFDDAATNGSTTATGLMQITKPAVATVNANTPDGVHFEHSEMTDAAKNIQCGSYYLDILYKITGDKTKTLNSFGTGDGYADNIVVCEKCLQDTPADYNKCLKGIHNFWLDLWSFVQSLLTGR